jgi:acyl-CoA synthetase (AMP-forming)/AMP-acid ligase II
MTVPVVRPADSERDQRRAAAGLAAAGVRAGDRVLVAELPRTSTGKVRRLDLPGVLGLTDG